MNDELPAGWASATVGDLGRYVNGRGFKTDEWREAGRPIIRIQNLTGSRAGYNYFQGEADECHVVRAGDLLVSWAATLGVFVWSGEEAVLNQHIFKVDSWIHKKFHRWLLEFVLNDLQQKAHGSGMVHITRGNFEATPVPVPPLAEQERIVAAVEEHFARRDFAEAALEVARAKLQALRRSVLAAAFSGRLTNPTHTTNTDPGQLPEGWRWTALHDLLEHTIGGAWGKPIDEDEVNVRVLRVTEFGEHTVLEPETGVVRAVSAKQLASRQLQLGDILLEKSGGGPNQPVGRVVAFRTHLAEPAVPTNFVQLLRPSRDAIDPAFLTWTLDWWHKNGTAEAHQRATTNIRNLQTKSYLAQPVAVPPRAEQGQVVATIEEHFSVLSAAETALDAVRAKVSAFRRSVLVEAFAGGLVPQDPGDEPATALLASIAAERPVRPTNRKGSA